MIKNLQSVETEIFKEKDDNFVLRIRLAHNGFGDENQKVRKKIQTNLIDYLQRNNAKIINAFGSLSSNVIYHGILDIEYYEGYIQIDFEKKIKRLGIVINNIIKLVEKLIEENKNITDSDEVENTEEKIVFNPENTAIDTNFSSSAAMMLPNLKENTTVLDYGCGTGRNMKFLLEKSDAIICGTDIDAQLEKQKEKHNILREKGCIIDSSEKIKDNQFKYVLNSHVLNVVESDEVKQFIVGDIYSKLEKGGKAFIEVRTKKDVENAKTKQPYGSGWKIKCKGGFTYQEGISKEKMISLLSNVGFTIEKHIFNNSKHIVIASK